MTNTELKSLIDAAAEKNPDATAKIRMSNNPAVYADIKIVKVEEVNGETQTTIVPVQ